MIDREKGNREFSATTLELVKPKTSPPLEVRLVVRGKLLECSDGEFAARLKDWNIIPYSYGHLDHQEMIELFDRLDWSLLSALRALHQVRSIKFTKSEIPIFSANSAKMDKEYDLDGCEDAERIEERVRNLLKGAINLLDIVKGVKYSNLFKSVDLLASVFLCTKKVENMALAIDVMTLAKTIIRKKILFVKYIGATIEDIAWYILVFAKFYEIFSANIDLFMSPGAQNEVIFNDPKFDLEAKLRSFRLDKSDQEQPLRLIDEQNEAEIFEKSNFVQKILYLLKHDWSDFRTRLSHYSVFLKSSCLYAATKNETYAKSALKTLKSFNTNTRFTLPWKSMKLMLSLPEGTPDFHCTVIRSKWSQLSQENFDFDELKKMKEILQKLMVNLNSSYIKHRRRSISATRKESAEHLERFFESATEASSASTTALNSRKLITPTSETLIAEIINAIKACYLFEERNAHINSSENDYSRILELVSSLLLHMKHQDDHLAFSPVLLNSVLDLVRVGIATDHSAIPKILDFCENLILSQKRKFFDSEKGEFVGVGEGEYNELVIEMVDVIDSLFIEPTKSFYIESIGQFARTVSEHSIWDSLPKMPGFMRQIYYSVVTLLDDILNELPENLVNNLLDRIRQNGLLEQLMDYFVNLKQLDFETIGFYLLLVCKLLISPKKPEDFDQKLKTYITKGFDCLLRRPFVKQNIMRFSGADSTNALVVLADEVIDLVNVRYTLREPITECMGLILDQMEVFVDKLWAEIPKTLLSHRGTEDGFLKELGWTFAPIANLGTIQASGESSETVEACFKDEMFFFDKLLHNLIKFFAKFYDIHRTNLHHDFEEIGYAKKVLRSLTNLPVFDLNSTKQRKCIATSFSKVVTQPGNEKHRKAVLEACYQLVGEYSDRFLELWKGKIRGRRLEGLVPTFFFKGLDQVAAFSLFSPLSRLNQSRMGKGGAGGADEGAEGAYTEQEVADTLKVVNLYNGVMVLMELVRSVLNVEKMEEEDPVENENEVRGHFKALEHLIPGLVAMERYMVGPKVELLIGRLKAWEVDLCSIEKEITFDAFSNYNFGALEMFSYETASKPIEKIFKAISSSKLPGKAKFTEGYAATCGKMLGTFKFTDFASEAEKIEKSQKKAFLANLELKEVFRITKTIQSFAYMISSFEEIDVEVLNALFEAGVVEFCQKAIIFGIELILKNKDDLMRLKSIKEHESPKKDAGGGNGSNQGLEESVRVDAGLNNLKYILETICPKLVFCWGILFSFAAILFSFPVIWYLFPYSFRKNPVFQRRIKYYILWLIIAMSRSGLDLHSSRFLVLY